MAVDIGPKIGIEGEKEFRKNLNDINQQLRTLGSEMKAVTSEFLDANDSEEKLAEQTKVLNKQINAQENKLGELNKALDFAVEAYGDADSRTQKWRQAVHDATADLNKMKNQLKKAEQGIDDFGDAASDSSDSLGDFAGVLKAGLGAGAVGAVIGGVKELAGAMMDIASSTEEYRSIMGTLEVSSQAAGYNMEQATETYKRFYSVLGDSQAAVTAALNIEAIGLSQSKVMAITDMAIGAWAKYGDSIPIDGLAEAINETIKVGQVTGTFADVLNWAGINEDEFNEKLQATCDKGLRANIVMQTMSKMGLSDLADAWFEVNGDIEKANLAQAEWDEAMAGLGEALAPAKDKLLEFGANGIKAITNYLKEAVEWFGRFGKAANQDAVAIIEEEKANFGSGVGSTMAAPVNSSGSASNNGSDANNGTINVNATLKLDGKTLARNVYTYNQAEANRRGAALVR